MVKTILKWISHAVFRVRQFNDRCITKFAKRFRNKKILELGSGKKLKGKYYYSARKFFDNSNEFVMSDINKNFGHRVVDVRKMKFKNEFDIIICMNVLEHVYEVKKAVNNVYNALKKNGILFLTVPVFYPLHDEPGDYWRFTEHTLRKLFKDFEKIKLKHYGVRQYPFAYCVEAIK